MFVPSKRVVICKVCLCALHENEEKEVEDIPGVVVNTKIYLVGIISS